MDNQRSRRAYQNPRCAVKRLIIDDQTAFCDEGEETAETSDYFHSKKVVKIEKSDPP